MAAVIVPNPTEQAPRRAPAPSRPALRIIDGGRSAARLARRRVYLRRRIGALVCLAMTAAVVWLAVLGAASVLGEPPSTARSTSAATAAVPPAAAEEYVVQPGDTLWVIARRLSPDGDVRPVVDELADRAGGPLLAVGQRIDLRGLGD